MIEAIVFDFDGVLADSEPLHLRSYQAVLEPLGVTLGRDEYYATYLGLDDYGAFHAVAAVNGWPADEARINALIAEKSRVLEAMIAAGDVLDVLYDGARESVIRLAARFPLGIASGALRHDIDAILRPTGLADYFKFIVAAGDTPASKPAPDPYRRAAELHGLPPTACVAIEDSRWGIESARGAGLTCVGITHSYPRRELSMADAIIGALSELTPDFIRSLE